ncbi:MAG: hypothetical protein M3Q29_10890 [Chloroflexota bacterium]|nr:hypothetical protein [Chloroflexota bacterium]
MDLGRLGTRLLKLSMPAEDRPERTAVLGAAAAALREDIGCPLPADDGASHRQTIKLAHAELGDGAFAALWTEGQTMDLDQAVEYARSFANPDLADER